MDRDSRGTIIAGSSGQRYIDNIFVNPDNDYEMIALNWTGYFIELDFLFLHDIISLLFYHSTITFKLFLAFSTATPPGRRGNLSSFWSVHSFPSVQFYFFRLKIKF